MDYDRNIHHNPDAMAWAKFFVETTKDMGREVFCDEGYMVGWFANAMMAMCDSMKPHEAADEIERLRKTLERVLSVQPIKGDEGSTDIIALAKALLEIDSIARAALKEKE